MLITVSACFWQGPLIKIPTCQGTLNLSYNIRFTNSAVDRELSSSKDIIKEALLAFA